MRSRGIGALSAAAALLGGCAVLTIDVDVYKGPLANDEQVQVEQVAVMAIGAKPLLVQLRDRLEVRGESARPSPRFTSLDGLRFGGNEWYELDYVRRRDRTSGFHDDRASQVNEVIGLYKDQGDVLVGEPSAILHAAWTRFMTAFARYGPQTMDQDAAASLDRNRPGSGAATLELTMDCDPKQVNAGALIEALREAYRGLLLAPSGGRWGRANRILLAHRCLAKLGHAEMRALPADVRDPALRGRLLSDLAATDVPLELSPNTTFRILAERRMVEAHARLLLACDCAAERARLVQRVLEIAMAWGEASGAGATAWQAALRTLIALPTTELPPGADRQGLTRDHIKFVAALTDPTLLAMYLEGAQPEVFQKLKRDLEVRGVLASGRRKRPVLDQDAGEKVVRRLQEWLTRQGAAAARALLDADRDIRAPEFARADMARYTVPESRKHGLAVAWHLPDGYQPPAFLSVPAQLGGFAGGRLPTGLETLIRQYRTMAQAADPRRGEILRQLLEELVGFAQKVLFIANFSSLAADDEPVTSSTPFDRAAMNEAVKDHTALLQAVGNSIVSQVDELRRADRHAREVTRRARTEDDVRRGTWDPRQGRSDGGQPATPQRTDPMAPVSDDDAEAQKRVLDRVIAELRYLHLDALKREGKAKDDRKGQGTGGGSGTEADRIEAALREAYQQRARMVYLRPAGAYLRNSNPFTQLQRDSGATWSNMLEKHALRQTPFRIGTSRDERRVIQEFDKQFWQNVNTVRVAGAGVTNYVVAKDDVGNWYIKGYSSDPKTIIQGAKSLALFAAGGSISADAVQRSSRTLGVGQTPEGQGPADDNGRAAKAKGEQIDTLYKQQTAQARDKRGRVAQAVVTAPAAARVAVEQALVPEVTDDKQRELVRVAIDLAYAAPECAAGAAGEAAVGQLGRLRDCRDKLINLIADDPIQAEFGRKANVRVKQAEEEVAGKKRARDAAADARNRARDALAAEEKGKLQAEAAVSAARGRGAPPLELAPLEGKVIDKDAAVKKVTDDLRQKETDASRAETELASAQADASTARGPRPATLSDASQSASRRAVREQFKKVALTHVAALEDIARDERTALSALLGTEGEKQAAAPTR